MPFAISRMISTAIVFFVHFRRGWMHDVFLCAPHTNANRFHANRCRLITPINEIVTTSTRHYFHSIRSFLRRFNALQNYTFESFHFLAIRIRTKKQPVREVSETVSWKNECSGRIDPIRFDGIADRLPARFAIVAAASTEPASARWSHRLLRSQSPR